MNTCNKLFHSRFLFSNSLKGVTLSPKLLAANHLNYFSRVRHHHTSGTDRPNSLNSIKKASNFIRCRLMLLKIVKNTFCFPIILKKDGVEMMRLTKAFLAWWYLLTSHKASLSSDSVFTIPSKSVWIIKISQLEIQHF